MKLSHERKNTLQKLRTWYCVNLAEDGQDGTVFEGIILDLLENDNVEKLLIKQSEEYLDWLSDQSR